MSKTAKDIEKSVNSRSTKSEVQKALKEAINTIKELDSKKFNPIEEKAKIEEQNTLKSVTESINTNDSKLSIDNIVNNIETLLGAFQSDHNQILGKIKNAEDNYHEINNAIQIQKNKLNELFGIEDVLIKLSDLITFHENKKVDLLNDYEIKQAELKIKLDESKIEIEKNIKQLEENYKNKKSSLELEMKRKLEQFEYDHERYVKIKTDEFNDELDNNKKLAQEEIDSKTRELKSQLNDFETNKQEFFKNHKNIIDLEQELLNLKETRETEIKQAIEEGKEKGKKSANFTHSLKEKDLQNKIDMLNSNVKSLSENILDKDLIIKDLKESLDNAHNKIQELANKSMESNSSKDTSNLFTTLVNEIKNNTKTETK